MWLKRVNPCCEVNPCLYTVLGYMDIIVGDPPFYEPEHRVALLLLFWWAHSFI